MTYDSSLSSLYEKAAYIKLFDALAGHNLLLEANPPLFTILAASPQRLQDVGMTKEAVVGKPLFEAHPGNSDDPTDNGVSNLRSSLDHVLRYKEVHQLPIQRYDLPDEQGRFSEKYWRASNRPVLNDKGDVIYIIHTADEITAEIKAAQREIQMAGVEKIFSLFMHAPMVVGLVNGDDYVLEMANEAAFKLWGKQPQEIIGKPILQGLPELMDQGIIERFDQVRTSGKPYTAHEVPVTSLVNGRREQHYFNLVYQPYYSRSDAKVTGVFTISHDVTEQVLAKRRTEESEAKYQTLFNSMDQGFCIIEMIFDANNKPVDYRFLEVNPMFEKQTGLIDATGKTAKQLVPDLEQHWIDLYAKVALTGEAVRFTEGSEAMRRWFDVFAFDIGNSHQYKVAVLFTDISEHKKAEAALKQSESNLRNMILQSPIAMAILRGPSFVVEIANDRMFELWGRGPGELLNKSIFEGLPEVRNQGYEELLTGVYNTGNRFTALGTSVTVPRKEAIGTIYINLLYEAFREADGSISGVMAVATDVTEQVLARKKLEENEAALEAALEQVRLSKEAAELGTFDMDLKNGAMHWDKRCRFLFGISHDRSVSFDDDFIKRLHPDDQDRVAEVVRRAFAKSLSNGDYDVEYRTIGAEDGIVRWVRAKGKVYFTPDEKPLRFIGSVLDITPQVNALQRVESLVAQRTKELAAANDNLSTLNKELQRSNANLEEFAHAASHDLKEPIRKIHFFTHQLREKLSAHLKESEVRSFSRIENATQRMGNLIDDLLLYSHVSHRPLETERVDLGETVQRVLEDLELDIEEKKAVVKMGKLPFVNGYKRQLQQLFQNLISNAIKYSKVDVPPTIDIRAEEVEKTATRYYRISVKDNGIGFDPVYADKIFQMFARLHGRAEYSGTGVGLSIVKKVVENHNGLIAVESEVNEGSVFKIYLPQ
ncbi:MAG: PAS domain-containing protein [Bacteroidota bacterium]|nr:PAS domain-containing protein [Bacteroidota bacterium]